MATFVAILVKLGDKDFPSSREQFLRLRLQILHH